MPVEPGPEPAVTPEFQAFVERMQAPASLAASTLPKHRRRTTNQQQKSLAWQVTSIVAFLLVVGVFAVWAYNAARAVSSFTSAVAAEVAPENALSLAGFH